MRKWRNTAHANKHEQSDLKTENYTALYNRDFIKKKKKKKKNVWHIYFMLMCANMKFPV